MELQWPVTEHAPVSQLQLTRVRQPEAASPGFDVDEFCRDKGIASDRDYLASLALKYFPGPVEIEFRVESDPESDETWLVVEAAHVDPTMVLEAYNSLLQEWIENTSPRSREHLRISFSVV